VALSYPSSPTTVFIIELTFEKVGTADTHSINAVHRSNIKNATTQVRSYCWKDTVSSTQKVVISAVGHPSSAGNFFELDIECEFLPFNT
jgi:hypothetical protein